ncbi:MAG: hypothetical protein WAS21_17675, partial [Geminicoccaceae bacterium]
MPATDPLPRSPAQIEAARRNGARSRGPITPEGKARASRNALKHGLAALEHLVLDGEDAAELAALTARLMAEVGPESEIEARLARRLAIAFWKGERAERIEVALFAAAPKVRPPAHGFQWEKADPLTTFDVKRFNAVRGYQAQQGRELSRCLKELRQLRKEARAESTDEPDAALRNEPDMPPTANDDAPIPRYPGGFDLDEVPPNEPGNSPQPVNADATDPRHTAHSDALRNEPEPDPMGALPPPVRAYLEQLLAA